MGYVDHYFDLKSSLPTYNAFGYGNFGETIYYLYYSRNINGRQENWGDTVRRIINGTFSIRKDWYLKHHLKWDEGYWQDYAAEVGEALYAMTWLPPGRGAYNMGTETVYDRGSMWLYNCAAVSVASQTKITNLYATDVEESEQWIEQLCLAMDMLMCGVGVGFSPKRYGLKLTAPVSSYDFDIPDTREGWVDAVRRTLLGFITGTSPNHYYGRIRPKGSIIRGSGGTASGPEPLRQLLILIEDLCYKYVEGNYDELAFKVDIANLIGCCVVAGNIRRSAEIITAPIDDPIFSELKNYKKHPYRANWGWMSNNSVTLSKKEDFDLLPEIAYNIRYNGEPGFLNLVNAKYGRIGKDDHLIYGFDKATATNPCGEILLEDGGDYEVGGEVCNLGMTLPTRCVDNLEWYKAAEYATFYTSTVSLLPTHRSEVNAIVSRNRRIGVAITDFTGWVELNGVGSVTKYLREGYKRVRTTNTSLALEAGVRPSIRVTTVKPDGTIAKIAGRTSGAMYPSFKYQRRRIRQQKGTAQFHKLVSSGVPYEDDVNQPDYTSVFSFGIVCDSAPEQDEISIWQQAMNVVLLQREWADNAVSNTISFRPMWKLTYYGTLANYTGPVPLEVLSSYMNWKIKGVVRADDGNKYKIIPEHGYIKIFEYDPTHEEDDVESVLAHIAPVTKSCSLLPRTPEGVYPQMPESRITKEEYEQLAQIEIDWSDFNNGDGQDQKFCTSESCEYTPKL